MIIGLCGTDLAILVIIALVFDAIYSQGSLSRILVGEGTKEGAEPVSVLQASPNLHAVY